jgi:hypothetical protein
MFTATMDFFINDYGNENIDVYVERLLAPLNITELIAEGSHVLETDLISKFNYENNSVISIKIYISSNSFRSKFDIDSSTEISFSNYTTFEHSFEDNEAFYTLFNSGGFKKIKIIFNSTVPIHLNIGNVLILSNNCDNFESNFEEFLSKEIIPTVPSTNNLESYLAPNLLYISNLDTVICPNDGYVNKIILELIRNFLFFLSTSISKKDGISTIEILAHKKVVLSIPEHISIPETSNFFGLFLEETNYLCQKKILADTCSKIIKIYESLTEKEHSISRPDLIKQARALIAFYLCSNSSECNSRLFLNYLDDIYNGVITFKNNILDDSISDTISEAIELSKYIDSLVLDLSDQISYCFKNLFTNLFAIVGILITRSLNLIKDTSSGNDNLYFIIFLSFLIFSYLLNLPYSNFKINSINERFQKLTSDNFVLRGTTFTKIHLKELGSEEHFKKHLACWYMANWFINIGYIIFFSLGVYFFK